VTTDEALIKLGESTAEAASGLLEMFAPGKVALSGVAVVSGEANPLEGMAAPAVATSVSYIDGVTGGNVLALPLEGARLLAASMMGIEQPEEPTAAELSELELSAVAEAANQMMASAAGVTSSVLGTEVQIGPPETRSFTTIPEAADAYPHTPHAVRVTFTVCGETCRLVQLVPNAFVVRMTRALDEIDAEVPDGAVAGAPLGGIGVAGIGGAVAGAGSGGPGAGPSLAGIPVRVWAELGRAQLPSAELVGLPSGSVVELDRQADDAIDLYVNGTLFATGRLMVVDGTDWAVRIETVREHPNPEPEMEVARWPESW
jgi:flagellar motor switch protein FliN/FliY